ncbi:hypothetical protein DDZ18_03090 [Marinicauda salina]|uniref:Agglutination protein n=1 Tax=Marinicauda salina TaxID=2135793 RepID=A0A2U2BXA9_9PROT|nr:TolC family protein [Marinicauda salina]PWE18604.1 hypothetical protein DDZ18_03090 [Marinicauda salina]
MFRLTACITASAAALLGAASAQEPVNLPTAVEIALNSNPEIHQAIQNREAIAFEENQARGLYRPRVLFEASAGYRELDNPSRDAAGLGDQTLEPLEASLFAEQVLFDGYGRRGELERQAARVDGAAARVLERSEFIALEVAREYINYGLQTRLVELAQENVDFHRQTVERLEEGVAGRTISETDLRQAQERLSAARRRLTEAQRDRVSADITFRRLVGMPVVGYEEPSAYMNVLPSDLDAAIGGARRGNPEIGIAQADISAAEGVLKTARSEYYPTISIEGRARAGQDLDAFEGDTTDFQIRAVMRWTLYNGGINQASAQENLRRVSEERFRLHQVSREIEEEVRLSWDRLEREEELLEVLREQADFSNEVVDGYLSQFDAGQRSLLDLLDAQNTRINVLEALATSRHAHLFAQYRMLASMGDLVETMGLSAPDAARGGHREAVGAPALGAGEDDHRRYP